MNNKSILVVGAGLSGSVIARLLAEAEFHVDLIDIRNHIAGNCYSFRDNETNIMIHNYGPHVFHTDNEVVWDFVSQYAEMKPCIHRVKAITGNQVFVLPINLHTINQFFKKSFSAEEAKDFIYDQADRSITFPLSFRDQALRFVGKEIYEAFFKGYATKQWGLPPNELPASILKRLPVRFNYDDNYFSHQFQGVPEQGYTVMVENILDHKNIKISLETAFDKSSKANYQHVFYSGALDEYFDYQKGRLVYRTLDFERFVAQDDYQGTEIINYCDESVPYSRIIEYKYFTRWEKHRKTIYYKEYSRNCEENDLPYYPVSLSGNSSVLEKYVKLAVKEDHITFIGRLGTYRYLGMDVAIAEALHTAKLFIANAEKSTLMPAFTVPMKWN